MKLSYALVQEAFPNAWKALPKTYQADSCLKFVWYPPYPNTAMGGLLIARHDMGERFIFAYNKRQHRSTWIRMS